MSRAEVAEWLAEVGKALGGEGTVSIRLADTTVDVKVPDQVRVEAELEVDGDEIELEIELKWSTARPAPRAARKNGSRGPEEAAAHLREVMARAVAAGQAAGTPESHGGTGDDPARNRPRSSPRPGRR